MNLNLKIYPPNSKANYLDYSQAFGLTDAEYQSITNLGENSILKGQP